MTLKVGVIGATGMAGSEITKEAIRRGFEVTAFVRNSEKAKDMFGDQTQLVVKDVFEIQRADIQNLDVVVDAFATHDSTKANQHVDLAARLIEFAKNAEKPRLFFILGAGSLETGNGHRLIDRLEKMPNNESFIEIPRHQFEEYKMLTDATDVNWVAVSPSATFKPGNATEYVLGHNDLLTNAEGKSEITAGTMAKVINDEIEHPAHHNERFTAVDK
ncbi:NAD(P)-dependent oxidoreductase [Lentilactobacillus otakiensis]|uniref:NAD(P)-dependent oxidoreductase n=1 Tax=Lentilactobacillus otakiensis TaxID=481720 RepID=UPI003D185F0E